MMKHTPGPWVYQHGDIWEEARKHMARRGKIADVSIAYLDSKTRDANAHLIAAAPDLLEALVYARRFLKEEEHDIDFVDAAIKKARGDV